MSSDPASFGRDMSFEYEDGIDLRREDRDVALCDGRENLYQAVLNRLLTPYGALPFHPDYGSRLHTMIGKSNHPVTERLVKMMVAESLANESRIALIQNIGVSFEDNGQTIRVDVQIVSKESEELNVQTTIR